VRKLMNDKLPIGGFTELTTEESTSVQGGSLMGFVLDIISNMFGGITGIVGTGNANRVNNTANSILDIIRSTARRFGLF